MRMSDGSSDVCSSDRASRQDLAEEDEKALHKVLTFSETALECAAPLTGRPPGRNIEGTPASTPKGVDESKNRAIMGGSHRQQSGRYGRRRDQKSVVEGKRVVVRVDHGGSRFIQK